MFLLILLFVTLIYICNNKESFSDLEFYRNTRLYDKPKVKLQYYEGTSQYALLDNLNMPSVLDDNNYLPASPNNDMLVDMQSKKDWNGDDLRQVREYRKLSFDELTDITKINPWYIAALEKMEPSNLPVEVFVRGYVLQVAKALGLKEKVVADSYMRNFRKKIEN